MKTSDSIILRRFINENTFNQNRKNCFFVSLRKYVKNNFIKNGFKLFKAI